MLIILRTNQGAPIATSSGSRESDLEVSTFHSPVMVLMMRLREGRAGLVRPTGAPHNHNSTTLSLQSTHTICRTANGLNYVRVGAPVSWRRRG